MCQYSSHPQSSSWGAQDLWDFDDPIHYFSSSRPWWQRPSLERYLLEPEPPSARTVEMFQCSIRRNRALAEIDGVVAGLAFLYKVEKNHRDDDASSQRSEPTLLSAINPQFSELEDSLDLNPIHERLDLPAEVYLNELYKDPPELNFPAEKMGDVDKALTGVKSLRRGMRFEFRRFKDLTRKLASPAISRIGSRFTSAKALTDCGILVYRDASEGLCPGTLEEVFAFATVSHAMSRILVRQKRMEEAQVLSGVQRWRDCIDDAYERSVFDTLASEMWPSSCVSFTEPEPPASTPQAVPLPESQNNASHFLQRAAAITAAEIDRLSGDALHAANTGIPPPSLGLEEDVLNITELTREEYNFSILRDLGNNDAYVPPKAIDPRELSKFCPPDQPILGYNPSPAPCPPLGGHPSTPNHPSPRYKTPPPLSSTNSPSCGQRLYHFPITDEVFDCKAINLRNTIAFLAVLAFVSDESDGFYLLSGSGKTTGCRRTGLTWASERSKAERKLREEFFDPLKKAGTDDAGFLALLAVAKKFVVLGLLRTKDEVQDYLITISKEFLTGGDRLPRFIRWIGFGQLPGSTAPNNSKYTRQRDHSRQQNKRREPPERRPDENGPTKKKQRVYRCEHPGCGNEYHSPSGLSKHKKTHVPVTEIFHCPNCKYSSGRRDLVRQHFVRQHGGILPPLLHETRRGHRGGSSEETFRDIVLG